MSVLRWVAGLVLMAVAALVVYLLLVEVGVVRWLACVIAIIVAVSLEPTSNVRRGLAQRLGN